MPRHLAPCYFRTRQKHDGGRPPNVSSTVSSTGQPRVLVTGPLWSAGKGCGPQCGFPPFWGEAMFTQPLLNARCPLEVRPVAVTLLRSSGVTSSHRGAADAAPTRDPYQYALQSPTRWAETQSQWRIGARARANDRIVC